MDLDAIDAAPQTSNPLTAKVDLSCEKFDSESHQPAVTKKVRFVSDDLEERDSAPKAPASEAEKTESGVKLFKKPRKNLVKKRMSKREKRKRRFKRLRRAEKEERKKNE